MATFPSTSVERRGRGKSGTIAALLLSALLLSAAPLLRAGSLITLTNGSEIDGKLSVTGTAIHTESASSSPPDTELTDVLEATFNDAPFTLTVFTAGTINQLPPNWTAQDIGEVTSPGSATVQDGAFTVTGSVVDPKKHGKHEGMDNLYFVGTPWLGDGQFTARIASLDARGEAAWAGIMFRDSLDPKASMCGALLTGAGQIRLPYHHDGRQQDWGAISNGQAPLWLRFTRESNTVFTSQSSDGNNWDIIAESPFATLTNPLVGLSACSPGDKMIAKAVFDHVSITPPPSSAQLLPAGVLLQGGSLLVGRISHLSLDPSEGDNNGELTRGDARMPIARSAIAAVVTLPIERSQLAEYSSKGGLLMRNGDTMDGDITEIREDRVSVSSVLLGLTTYQSTEVRACFLAPLQAKPAPYEVRLHDGSILNATSVTGDPTNVTIIDVSGVSIQVGADEIAQVRAGTSAVQNLAQLDWKATGPNGAPAPPPTPAPAAANGAAAANPAPEPAPPLVDSWLGKDQQQILEAGMGTAIDFPLPGKFRAFGVQIALSSDSPPNATATIHILTDGHELAKSPPFRVGDSPRFLELTLPSAAHITLQAESSFPGTKVLYLDPVAIR